MRSRSGKILHFFIVLMPVVGSYLLEDVANLRKERSGEYFPDADPLGGQFCPMQDVVRKLTDSLPRLKQPST